ncbi:MAG: glycosyltransferase, partial [Betaproteobacteria bacterium]|nr:glycosyltransferase [Betaproteobacteria bacterium]
MVKRVLMVAFHFPPMNVSSGIQRTLRFAQYLPEFNWEPLILSAHPRAYSGVSPASLGEVPP